MTDSSRSLPVQTTDPVGAAEYVLSHLRGWESDDFVVLEHVAAPEGSALARLQRALWGGWRWAFEGCDLQRHTGELLAGAGFADVDLERYRVGSTIFRPVDEQIAGTLTR